MQVGKRLSAGEIGADEIPGKQIVRRGGASDDDAEDSVS